MITLQLTCCLMAAAGAAALPAGQTLFREGEGPYASYRIPALTVTPQGTVLAFCEGRRHGRGDSGDIDIVLRRSEDGGKTWGPLQVVVADGANTCGNPAPVVVRDTGTILLPFTKNDGGTNEREILAGEGPPRTVWLTSSIDEGRTWSEPREISAMVRRDDFRWYATGPGHAIETRDGRLVVPANHSLSADQATWYSHVIYSEDGGKTWRMSGAVGPHANESTAAELPDGRLYLNMRSYRGNNRRLFAYSSDAGETWSEARESVELVEPVCQASVLSVPATGDRPFALLFSNPASTQRERMTVRVSVDEGATWSSGLVLWDGPAAYSDLTLLPGGGTACLYERGAETPYETIVFQSIPFEALFDNAPE